MAIRAPSRGVATQLLQGFYPLLAVTAQKRHRKPIIPITGDLATSRTLLGQPWARSNHGAATLEHCLGINETHLVYIYAEPLRGARSIVQCAAKEQRNVYSGYIRRADPHRVSIESAQDRGH